MTTATKAAAAKEAAAATKEAAATKAAETAAAAEAAAAGSAAFFDRCVVRWVVNDGGVGLEGKNLSRYEEEHHGGDKIYLLDL